MAKPLVALVGRPNVGKSTLFNVIVGKRLSIVEDTPGVTRDRIYAEAEWLDNKFSLVDTGGIEPSTQDLLLKEMRSQAQIAIDTANVIIFVVDGRVGVTASDMEIASMLRKAKKNVVVACNKLDNPQKDKSDIYEFYNLGLGEPMMVSAVNMRGIGDMLDEVIQYFKTMEAENEENEVVKIALVGKPNVGKSSITNAILGENRTIVSNIPGTTRDAIDTPFKYNNENYLIIDTAGMRRKSKVDESVERYSVIRSVAAVDRADVCMIVIDATEGVTEQDAKIAGIAHDSGKACIIVVNKWDAVDKDTYTINKFEKEIREKLAYMQYAPIIFVSAVTKQRLTKLIDMAKAVNNNNSMRVTTGMLNDVIHEAVAMQQPPSDKGRILKVYYASQVSVKPPTFVVFVNDEKLMHYSYMRYIENQIRKAFGFMGTPIKMISRGRKDKEN
jgi:GTP-binding protein